MQPSAADILTLGYVLRLNCQPAASSTRKTDNTLIRGEKVMKERECRYLWTDSVALRSAEWTYRGENTRGSKTLSMTYSRKVNPRG